MTDDTPDGAAPLVSAIVTTYNRPSYLERAVESIRAQTYDPLELVVVDDHSETRASRVLDGMDLDRFRDVQCVRHEENRGANAARNTGIRAATGEYVAFLDDDDRWRSDKTERQVAALDGSDAGVAYTSMETVNDGRTETVRRTPVGGNMTKALLCRNVVGSLSTVMVRADLAEAVPLDERFPSWADLEWYVNLSTRAGFRLVAEPLTVYEFDSHNRLSADFEKTRTSYELFVEEFDGLAARYGRLFRRKMRGWAAHRAGSAALNSRQYDHARRFLAVALAWYPFEPRFVKYSLATVGGQYTHDLARTVTGLVS